MPITLDLPWSSFHRLSQTPAPAPLQKHHPCPFCAGESKEELLRLDNFQCFEDRDGANRITHRVVLCRSCAQVYTDPWLTREASKWLLEKAGASYGHCHPEERVDWILRRAPHARSILDLGCGDGAFLKGFPESYALMGMDSDPHLIASARRAHSRIQFLHLDLEETFNIPPVDVITLFHLLEHVTHPRQFLTHIRNATGKETRLVVEVPILDRAIEIQGRDLCGFFSIPHRSHFSRHSVERMLLHCGWEIEHRTNLAGNGYRVLARKTDPVLFTPDSLKTEEEVSMAHSYVKVRQESVKLVEAIVRRLPKNSKILIWGAGHHTEFLAGLPALFSGKRRFIIVDRDPLKSGMHVHSIPVLKPECLPDRFWNHDPSPILISSFTWQESIYKGLLERGVAPERIVRLYP